MTNFIFMAFMILTISSVIKALDSTNTRIVGGRETDITKYPFTVSIRYRTTPNDAYRHQCAGAIYSERVVITAAQCLVDIGATEKLMVVAGANSRTGLDGILYPALKWIAHESYSSWTVDYDIGIIIIDDKFDFSHLKISPISIKESRPIEGRLANVVGWGYREEYGPSSLNLEEVQVPIVNSDVCTNYHGPGEITERMICAGYASGGMDSCYGDTGGPLVFNGELVGLVSWGRGCARPNFPSVYTYVYSLKKWIDDTIAANM
ncbi:kappaTry [Haematobia irritans]|uniref:kappaTry n=1 Tax=Haematobia irritans TaxID=7368 RepID=UPI003F4FBF05